MSAIDDVARMLALVPWLLERPGASVSETAEAFGVSEATIRRDLEQHLDFCGLPGLGGGDLFDVSITGDRIVVSMADELRRPLRPTPAEALGLVLGLDAVAEVLTDELPALRSAVDRVRAALGVPEQVADVVDPPVSALALQARGALAAGRRVQLRYQGRRDHAPRTRTVEPFAVRLVRGAWYLQGRDVEVDQLRTFRLDRASGLRTIEEPIASTPPRQLPEPTYQPGPDDLEVVLRCAPSARWVADAVEVDERREGPDGQLEVAFSTDAPRHVLRLVLSAGGGVEVLAPGWLRDDVAAAADAALARARP